MNASARSDRLTPEDEKAMRGEKTSNYKVSFSCELLLLGKRLYLFDIKFHSEYGHVLKREMRLARCILCLKL